MSLDDRLFAGQPGADAQREMCYSGSHDNNFTSEDMNLFSQWFESSGLIDGFSDQAFALAIPSGFDQGTENSMDRNFHQNFQQTYSQDFSNFSDSQFNRLVNENQTLQLETQDSPSNVVQVKIEEELSGSKCMDG